MSMAIGHHSVTEPESSRTVLPIYPKPFEDGRPAECDNGAGAKFCGKSLIRSRVDK